MVSSSTGAGNHCLVISPVIVHQADPNKATASVGTVEQNSAGRATTCRGITLNSSNLPLSTRQLISQEQGVNCLGRNGLLGIACSSIRPQIPLNLQSYFTNKKQLSMQNQELHIILWKIHGKAAFVNKTDNLK